MNTVLTDEMNAFMPQSIQTQIELSYIANIVNWIMSPKNGQPIIKPKQDTVLGSYALTKMNEEIDWRDVMNLAMYIKNTDHFKISKNEKYNGKKLFSTIIPSGTNINLGKKLTVVNGEITNGIIDKKTISITIQSIWDKYGKWQCRDFIDDIQRLIVNWLFIHGSTIGYGDMLIDSKTKKEIETMINSTKLEIDYMITTMENYPELMNAVEFEKTIKNNVDIAGNIGKTTMDSLAPNNNLLIIVDSGAKGGSINIGGMVGGIGQQILMGKRIQKRVNNRTLPHLYQNDDSALARGFVEHSYVAGLTPMEFFFCHMTGREGLIDTAIKSVTGDTPIIIMNDGIINKVNIGDWIDTVLDTNKDKVKHYTEREMELLNLENQVYIPTTDENGNVKWGIISAITRHDPGKELYEIKTHGGRKVIVTESKSLLIWNNDKFERKSTPDVKIGDFVPVTAKLENPPIETKFIDISKYLPKDEYIYGTDFNKFELSHTNGNRLGLLIAKYKLEYLPYGCFNAPKEFIAGLIDGYITENGTRNIISISLQLLNDLNICLTRLGIFGKIDTIQMDDSKILYMLTIDYQLNNKEFKLVNDVVLDEIVEINKIDIAKYPKVYDLTVPSTLNFGLANGLHVVDTADTGYISRKMMKALEDMMVTYDGTVRGGNNALIQFNYGDSNLDQSYQKNVNLSFIEYGDKKLKSIYQFDETELKDIMKNTGINESILRSQNDTYMQILKGYRNNLREMQKLSTKNYKILETSYSLPTNVERIVDDNKLKNNKTKNDYLDPIYIVDKIEELLKQDNTRMNTCTKENLNNPNSWKFKDQYLSKTLFRYELYSQLSPKQCIIQHKLTKYQFDNIINEIKTNFEKAMTNPGEMVGCLSAQSLGEGNTQMTLNTFHLAGMASEKLNVGIPRFREILSCSKNIKTPDMTVYLNGKNKYDESMAHIIAAYIKYTKLQDILLSIDIIYDPIPYAEDGLIAKDKTENMMFAYGHYSTLTEQQNASTMPWIIKCVLNKDRLIEKNITMLDIKIHFINEWNNLYNDIHGIKKNEKELISKVTQLAIMSNYDNSTIPIIHIRLDLNDISLTTLIDIQDIILNFKLKGLNEIADIAAIVNEQIMEYNEDNEPTPNKEYVIHTEGTNMKSVRNIYGIDLQRTTTNDIIDIYNNFGIEAARASLLYEINCVFNVAGDDKVNYHHIAMLVDTMTNVGDLTSIDRHGIGRLDTDPMSRAAFENTIEHFINAGLYNETDYMRGVSSRIIAGRAINGGTGYCRLIMDNDLLENSEYVDIKDVKLDHTFNELTINNLISDIIANPKEESLMPL